MKLLNFDLSQPSFAIELIGLGFVWDLHNVGDFTSIAINPNDNAAVMCWAFASGHPSSKYSGCNLVFRGLKEMIVSPRDADRPLSEDTCVSGISEIVPDRTEILEYRTRAQWGENDPFQLLFRFQSQRWIEIDAEVVELVGIEHTA